MKYALGIEYFGHNFYGWQAQNNLPTIQGHIELALAKVLDEDVVVFCAGRTDAGVHAFQQVIHFETDKVRELKAYTLGINSYLPGDISVHWAKQVDDELHARFSALSRSYKYIIFNKRTKPAVLNHRVTWFYETLDAELMHEAGQYLLGENDFTSFRSSQCESKTPMRNVTKLSVKRQENYIVIEITANAFLHHMVRNIVGVLLEVGTLAKNPKWVTEVLKAKDRKQAGVTAKPDGLYLHSVLYPSKYDFPEPCQDFFIP